MVESVRANRSNERLLAGGEEVQYGGREEMKGGRWGGAWDDNRLILSRVLLTAGTGR